MDDDFLKYPGSKRSIRSVVQAQARRDVREGRYDKQTWGDPVVKKIRGESLNLYTVGCLARALGRSVPSIRLWERQGKLPPAPFVWKGDPGPKGGSGNRRYYTEAAITAAVTAFDEADLLVETRVDWSSDAAQEASAAIFAAWSAEVEKYST